MYPFDPIKFIVQLRALILDFPNLILLGDGLPITDPHQQIKELFLIDTDTRVSIVTIRCQLQDRPGFSINPGVKNSHLLKKIKQALAFADL